MDDGDDNEGATMSPAKQMDDAALDRWLRASLRARYAETLREPVPEALLELLRASEP